MSAKFKRRVFWFFLSLLLLFVLVLYLPQHSNKVVLTLDAPSSPQTTAEKTKPRLVQTFDAATLKTIPNARLATKLDKPTQKEIGVEPKPEIRTSPQKKGTAPTLDADFSKIGFDTYLNVVERLGGRFFLLTEQGLGPEVSLKEGRVLGPRVEAGLAVDRPHLVTDPAIRQRLKSLSTSSAVLLWSAWFDAFLWEQIEEAVLEQDQTLNNIALIKAAYHQKSSVIYLTLFSAVVREDGTEIDLNRVIRLPL